MARRMVAVYGSRASLRTLVLGALLFGASACSSFDPVEETHFQLLETQSDYQKAGLSGPQWVAYDDQHSLLSACTNGAAGNHDPKLCSLVSQPAFNWLGQKCVSENGSVDGRTRSEALTDGYLADPGPDGSVCIKGVIPPLVPCEGGPEQCIENNGDTSNMWGAGFGLRFSAPNGPAWNAEEHHVRGVAFDLTNIEQSALNAPDETNQDKLNLRVVVPIVLSPDTQLPSGYPLMRADGSVIGKDDGKVYSYDCDAGTVSSALLPEGQLTGTLADVRDGDEPSVITTEFHPLGSPFWQQASTSEWKPSPIRVGHNVLEWDHVLPPKGSAYSFDDTQIVGVHFQIVHGDPPRPKKLNFEFCVEHLALLLE